MKVEFGKGKVTFEPKYKPEVKVTCKLIKEYKVEKYGFNYIAYIVEIKRKLGLSPYDVFYVVEELKNCQRNIRCYRKLKLLRMQ